MSRAGAITLADTRAPYVVVVCGPYGRRGRFAVARPIEKHGDKVPEVEVQSTLRWAGGDRIVSTSR